VVDRTGHRPIVTIRADMPTTGVPACALMRKFTGKERDAESGLDYFGARHYASSMGRFMTPDSPDDDKNPPGPVPFADFRDPQTLNLYAYVRNNPPVWITSALATTHRAGRWMTPDAINLTDERIFHPANTLNKFTYGGNNPLKYTDPDGRDITVFYTDTGPAGHFWMVAYNQSNGESAVMDFGAQNGDSRATQA
jgi:RHS repeat-associated protein